MLSQPNYIEQVIDDNFWIFRKKLSFNCKNSWFYLFNYKNSYTFASVDWIVVVSPIISTYKYNKSYGLKR